MEATAAFSFARKSFKLLTKMMKAQPLWLENCPSYQDVKDCCLVSLAALSRGQGAAKRVFLGSLALFLFVSTVAQ